MRAAHARKILLLSQRSSRLDAGGAAGGADGGETDNGDENDDGRCERPWIRGADFEEHRPKKPGQDERAGQPDRDAGCGQARRLAQDERDDAGGGAPSAMRTPISCVRWRTP
jgi:hypothetical protein